MEYSVGFPEGHSGQFASQRSGPAGTLVIKASMSITVSMEDEGGSRHNRKYEYINCRFPNTRWWICVKREMRAPRHWLASGIYLLSALKFSQLGDWNNSRRNFHWPHTGVFRVHFFIFLGRGGPGCFWLCDIAILVMYCNDASLRIVTKSLYRSGSFRRTVLS